MKGVYDEKKLTFIEYINQHRLLYATVHVDHTEPRLKISIQVKLSHSSEFAVYFKASFKTCSSFSEYEPSHKRQ